MDTPRLPHKSSLRTGRLSIDNTVYAVTSCVENRAPRLIPDPFHPETAADRAQIVVSCLRWLHDAARIICHGYVVMPDHMHIVFGLCEGQQLSKVMKSFGSFTARKLNTLDRTSGRFWEEGFFDHIIRGQTDFSATLEYLAGNPVRKGYVLNPEDWPYSESLPGWDPPGREREILL